MATEALVRSIEQFGLQHLPTEIVGVSSFRRFMEEVVIKVKIEVAARLVAGNKHIILPSESVYSIVMNGYNCAVVEAAMRTKGKPESHRPGIIESPSVTQRFIDFQTLAEIHSKPVEEMREVFDRVYQITPIGLIVPVLNDALPAHLTTNHRELGVPTVLAVWNNRYKPWRWFTAATAKYPHVLDVGTSVNEHHKESLSPLQARRVFGKLIVGVVEDPLINRHPNPGSYPHYDMLTGKIIRLGYLVPDEHKSIIDSIKSFL